MESGDWGVARSWRECIVYFVSGYVPLYMDIKRGVEGPASDGVGWFGMARVFFRGCMHALLCGRIFMRGIHGLVGVVLPGSMRWRGRQTSEQ